MIALAKHVTLVGLALFVPGVLAYFTIELIAAVIEMVMP
jgi:hypothetical protein